MKKVFCDICGVETWDSPGKLDIGFKLKFKLKSKPREFLEFFADVRLSDFDDVPVDSCESCKYRIERYFRDKEFEI